ncbi:ABC transporter permease [Spirosoma terrae]|uniref:FtsX-like permease family protein n=1 Tax=Spirosoma terrae TaxID=1968276 RepID=A0A6L9LEJ4_9BACT|nr:ABC transporter permease [Spirosoma terrae]NDU98954.1 FtsX-like permease family protein [Spirosoma terrae]
MKPPRFATWLLATFAHPDRREEVQGDLLELYTYWVETVGERNANWKYNLNALKLLRPLATSKNVIQNAEPPFFLSPAMLRNYLKIAWRNLVLHKGFTAINVIGLAVGLVTCLLIILFVLDELSYDRYYANADRIYRMTIYGRMDKKDIRLAYAAGPAGQALQQESPGVEAVTRLRKEGALMVKNGTDIVREEQIAFVDSNFFSVLTIPFLKGHKALALIEPNTLVLTETVARKYFGKADPIGKTLQMGHLGLFRITGICANVPSNTHFHSDMFASLSSVKTGKKWLASGAYTYIRLREGYSIGQVEAAVPALVRKYIAPEIKDFFGTTFSEFQQKGNTFTFHFQPITDIHLHSDLDDELEANSDIKYLYIFSAIALFILLLACINFMNLSTAGSVGRSKEVGIRKVLGSIRQQLVSQFLAESVLVTFLALGLALGLVLLLLPSFNELAGKQFTYRTLVGGWMLPGIGLACLVIGLLAGSYPAFVLSSFRPILVLKGTVQSGSRSGWLRSTLVITQFVVSISMIIATIVANQQLRFIQNKKVGFDKEQILVLQDTHVLGDKLNAFKDELGKLASVVRVSRAGFLPAGTSNQSVDGVVVRNGSEVSTHRTKSYYVDEDYLPTLGIKLVQGRNFLKATPSENSNVLINEAAAQAYGFRNPIGKQIAITGDGTEGSKRTYTIVGMVNDFHFESMRQHIAPLIMFYGHDTGQLALRIQTGDIAGLLRSIEQQWKARTDNPFSYSFLNERFNTIYQSEQRIGRLVAIFAGLAVIIACLGLFGLAALTTHQRTKEIGVRKVLGASVGSVVVLLSKDFLKLVGIAIVIASPISWYGMHEWLQDFAYKTDLSWWVFALAGLLAIGIALATVSFQSIKAALMNPVKSLRSE